MAITKKVLGLGGPITLYSHNLQDSKSGKYIGVRRNWESITINQIGANHYSVYMDNFIYFLTLS